MLSILFFSIDPRGYETQRYLSLPATSERFGKNNCALRLQTLRRGKVSRFDEFGACE